MTGRHRLAAAAALAMLALSVCASNVDAQSLPQSQESGIGAFLADPSKWVTDVFNSALLGLGKSTTDEMRDSLSGLLGGSGNLINQTPPRLSYENDVVKRLWGVLQFVANSGLGVVTVWSGINLIVHPHVRAPYHGALELIPRVLVGALLVNTSLNWGRLTIDANNALCQALGVAALPGWSELSSGNASGLLMTLIGFLIYLVMGALLLGQMLMRLALVDALLVISPIALLCWVVPQTYGWARLWFNTFFGTVFVQFLQVAVLQLGSGLLQGLVTLLPSVGANPVEGGGHWLASLLLGISILQLARRVPRLMPGYPAVGASTAGQLGIYVTRQLVSTVTGQRSGRGKR